VLLITIDTTRADRVGCYGYAPAKTPHIDALAARGVRFAQAYSPVPLTLPAHCSILTGEYPFVHRVRNNGFYLLSPEQVTLAEILKARGFSTSAFVASFTLDSRFGLAQGFDLYDDTFDRREALKSFRSERTADHVASAFLDWIERNGQKRFFSWVHFFDPHLPYSPPSPFDQEFKGRPYDGEIAFMDREIGRIIAGLDGRGLADRTLLVLAGDHGEALGEKREIDHGLFIYESTLRVPLILCAPQGLSKGTTVEARVRLIDILPTVLDLLKIDSPRKLSGQSLVPFIIGRKKDDLSAYAESFYPRENYGWSELLGLVEGRWKYISAPKPELYDLVNDSREEKNLANEEVRTAASLSEKLAAMIVRKSPDDRGTKRSVSAEEEAKLRSLGYAGGRSELRPSGLLPDPKDKIEDYILYFRGNLFETRGEYEQAEACYQRVLASNPDVPWNYVNLGILQAKMDRPTESIKTLEEGQKRLPGSIVILSHLMAAYLRAGQSADALASGREILAVDPDHFDALYVSGTILVRQNKWDEALSLFERALRVEPENEPLRRSYNQALAERQKRPPAA
jgi:arylsulfatase A-like enzyme